MAFAAQWYEQFAVNGILVGSTSDWLAAGLTRRKLEGLVAAGQVVRVRRGAYAASGLLDQETIDPGLGLAAEAAAALATGRLPGTVVSHHCAARLHGMTIFRESTWRDFGTAEVEPAADKVTLTIPPPALTRRRSAEDVVLHVAALPRKHVEKMFFGVPVTTGARTVVDIARTATFREAVVTADTALRTRSATKSGIQRVLQECKGWPGVERAREVAEFATNLSESVLESCARVTFRDHGLPAPELQTGITDKMGTIIARADFCWPDFGTLAEGDGMLKYRTEEDMAKHLRRESLLQAEGWDVVHFTWTELFSDPEQVVGRIRTSFAEGTRLDRRSRSLPH
jgi:very-short-patch-repair endonuclease